LASRWLIHFSQQPQVGDLYTVINWAWLLLPLSEQAVSTLTVNSRAAPIRSSRVIGKKGAVKMERFIAIHRLAWFQPQR
jgi:hypothetical protein